MLRVIAGVLLGLGSLGGVFASLPTTTNYSLQSYGFGSGGGTSSTSNYSLEGITGELSGQSASTTNYSALPGFIQTQQANVPKVTLSNPSNYYDKLYFDIDQQNNPTDALYAMEISTTSDFSSGNNYVQMDHTIGPTLLLADYQTYSAWTTPSHNIIGLSGSTTYYLRALATQGEYTQSGWGPSSSAATVAQSVSFCLYTSGSCAGGGNTIAFGNIPVSTITTSPNNIGTDFATNADYGGSVYIYSLNGGLKSASSGYTITSATADLSAVNEGFGAQVTSVSQTSGGPLSSQSPFNNSGNNVGILSATVQILLNSNNPLVGGTAATQLQVKPSSIAAAKSDYSETLTVIAAASF